MPFNGSGTFSIINTAVGGTTILASQYNQNLSDVASGLSTCVLKDGTQAITTTIPFSLSSTVAVPVRIVSTNADANAGPIMELYRDSASPVDGDVAGAIYWYGEDSIGDKTLFVSMTAVLDDITSGTEDGSLNIGTTVDGGSVTTRMKIAGGVYHPSATGGDKGNNSLNFGEIYEDNVRVANKVANTFGPGLNTFTRSGNPPVVISRTDSAASTVTAVQFNGSTSTDCGTIGIREGSTPAFVAASDRHLKDSIADLSGAEGRIMEIRPVDYVWKSTGRAERGFIAQEFATVYPDDVIPGNDLPVDDPEFVPWKMIDGHLTPDMVATMRGLVLRVRELEGKLEALLVP